MSAWSTLLDVIEVERDGADVADNRTRPPLADEVDVLADVGAVEGERVALRPGPRRCRCRRRGPTASCRCRRRAATVSSPLVAVDEVVAVAAEQGVGAVAAADGVVAGAGVERELRSARRGCRPPASVSVAAEGLHDDVLSALRSGRCAAPSSEVLHLCSVGDHARSSAPVAAAAGGVGVVAAVEQRRRFATPDGGSRLAVVAAEPVDVEHVVASSAPLTLTRVARPLTRLAGAARDQRLVDGGRAVDGHQVGLRRRRRRRSRDRSRRRTR